MSSKAYRTWLDRIESGTFTKAQCGQWAHAVHPIRHGITPQGRRTNLTVDEAEVLYVALVARGGVNLTPDHTEQGLAWIRNYHAAEFPAWVVESFARFSFQGDAYDHTDGNGHWPAFVPVWRIHSTDGRTLDYAAAAWQSGQTGPRILARSK